MNANDIMRSLGQRYADCVSYADDGEVYRWDHGCETAVESPEVVFKTYFSRPSRFRFEWTEREKFNIICGDGRRVRSHYGFSNSTETSANLSYAIAGATGVSMGAAHDVPALLLPEVRACSRSLLLLKAVEFIVDHSFDDCWCLCGSGERHKDTTLWISQSNMSLRAIREETIMSASDWRELFVEVRQVLGDIAEPPSPPGDSHYYTETRYISVSFDEPINDSVFQHQFTDET